ncbi:Fic family protein [Herbidospora sp. RD11066]
MLYPTPAQNAVDLKVLAEIDAMRQSLRHQVRQSPAKWTAGMRKFLTADLVAASNAIEGFRVSTVDVEDIFAGERDVDVSDTDREETVAYQRMMTYVQTLHDAPDFGYGKGLLNGLHWMLQGHRHTPRLPAGQWRRGPVYVSEPGDPGVAAYTAPGAPEVPELMAELVDWLNAPDDTHPLVRAAMAHLHLVSIHPWADGNGRMSRSLQTLMIGREGELAPEFSSIEAWLGRPRHTWEYYRELASRGSVYRPDQDVSSWLRFNLVAYHQQAQTVAKRIAKSAGVWEMLDTFAQAQGFDPRVATALHDVAMEGRVRRSRYEQAETLSLQQAQRDLRDLTVAGVIEAVGRTRARFYTAGPRFPHDVLEIAQQPFTLVDPYQG